MRRDLTLWCGALRCDAMWCGVVVVSCVMWCDVTSCHADVMWRDVTVNVMVMVMRCDVMRCDATWHDVTWCVYGAMRRGVVWCDVEWWWCSVMWRDSMWCGLTLRDDAMRRELTWSDHVTWCDAMWRWRDATWRCRDVMRCDVICDVVSDVKPAAHQHNSIWCDVISACRCRCSGSIDSISLSLVDRNASRWRFSMVNLMHVMRTVCTRCMWCDVYSTKSGMYVETYRIAMESRSWCGGH